MTVEQATVEQATATQTVSNAAFTERGTTPGEI